MKTSTVSISLPLDHENSFILDFYICSAGLKDLMNGLVLLCGRSATRRCGCQDLFTWLKVGTAPRFRLRSSILLLALLSLASHVIHLSLKNAEASWEIKEITNYYRSKRKISDVNEGCHVAKYLLSVWGWNRREQKGCILISVYCSVLRWVVIFILRMKEIALDR